MKVDTGASLTLISENIFHDTWSQNKLELKPSSAKLQTYTGEQIYVLGSLQVVVTCKN